MTLPTSRELREMIERASPHPWQKEWGFITPSNKEPDRLLADLGGAYRDVYPRKEDTDLMLIAPQLAEEVIRLRKKLARTPKRQTKTKHDTLNPTQQHKEKP